MGPSTYLLEGSIYLQCDADLFAAPVVDSRERVVGTMDAPSAACKLRARVPDDWRVGNAER
jgi:hypothetical protein